MEDRLVRLERRCRILTAVLLAGVTGALLSAAADKDATFDTITARRLEIVDEKDHPRIVLTVDDADAATLGMMLADSGKEKAKAKGKGKEKGKGKGKDRGDDDFRYLLKSSKGETHESFHDPSGTSRWVLTINHTNGTCGFVVADPKGTPRVAGVTERDGSASLGVADSHANTVQKIESN